MRRSLLCVALLIPALSACGSKTDDRLKAVEARLAKLEAAAQAGKVVTLKPSDTGYGLIQTDMGPVAVTIAKVEPSQTGSRVTLDFGNPTAARLSGMKAQLQWGPNDAQGKPGAAAGTTSFAATEPLPPGSWKQYPVDLAGVLPTQLGWVKVSGFDTGNVDLLSQ
jgi:hypothetical protein